MADSSESMTQSVPSRIAFETSVTSARVGRALWVMDWSIWVAVMTGFALWFASRVSFFLNDGDLLDRRFLTEVPAGDHDAVGDAEDLFDMIEGDRPLDFRDHKRIIPESGRGLTDRLDVGSALDKGLAHRVDPLGRGERETLAVALGEGADPEIDSGEVEPFPRPKLAADDDVAEDIATAHGRHRELDHPVVQKQKIAGLDDLGKPLEIHRHSRSIAGDLLGREHERRAGLKHDGLRERSCRSAPWARGGPP